jgi:RNA polymerase sigma-70 factor (ECF subfamily)
MTDMTLEIAPHLPRLRRYARSLLRDSVRADDLVQDTMVRALEKAHLYQHDTNLRGWLVTIMHNEHVNATRRIMRAPVHVSDEAVGELGRAETQEAPVELREVRRAVRRLPAEQRTPSRPQIRGDRRQDGRAARHRSVAHLAGAQGAARHDRGA